MHEEQVFAMPDLGEGLEEGEISDWVVEEGDRVTRNQPIVELETAKATVEIPSTFAGVATHLHGALGVSNLMPLGGNGEVMATVDGPTEVHLVTVARQVIKEHKPSEDNWPTQFRPRRLLESRRAFDEIVSRRLDPSAQEELSALVQHGQANDEAVKRFAEVAAGNHRGYALLARLNLAAQHAAGGRRDEAVKIYDEVAASQTADPNLRTAARLRAALLILDTAPREDIVRRVGDLNTPDNVWRNQAREILALAAYRAKDFTEADKLMNDIVLDQEAPQDMRQRAQIMISLLAPQLDAKTPKAQ